MSAPRLEFHLLLFDPRDLDTVGPDVARALGVPLVRTPSRGFEDRRDQDRYRAVVMGMEVTLRKGAHTERGFRYRIDGATRSAYATGCFGRVDLDAYVARLLSVGGFEDVVDLQTHLQEREA